MSRLIVFGRNRVGIQYQRCCIGLISCNNNSLRSIHIQRSNQFNLQSKSRNQSLLHLKQNRNIWIPPVWLRPLIRPLIAIGIAFLSGVIMQAIKGSGKPVPQWLLSATSEAETVSGTAINTPKPYGLYIFGGSVLIVGLYLTRFYNPLYGMIIGESQHNLEIADSYSTLPLMSYWDTRTANDSMKPRLRAMEKYIGLALSTSNNDTTIMDKANKIRIKGYTNAVITAKNRAKHYAEAGELKKFNDMLSEVEKYVMEGGIIDSKEIDEVKKIAYGKRAKMLLGDAQTYANIGDVSQCLMKLSEINDIIAKFNDIKITNKECNDVLNIAHKNHLNHMINEAKKIKENGSRMKAKELIQQAILYAKSNELNIDDNIVNNILN